MPSLHRQKDWLYTTPMIKPECLYRNFLVVDESGFACGLSITVNHLVAGGVAPVNKTVTCGTATSIPGEPTKCWITKILVPIVRQRPLLMMTGTFSRLVLAV
ncbi:MAG: hypothetical protein IPH20_23295 [Bacteroidales bacterium]|nr:hypothetical protein [Bacteroidales bacterium]